MSVGANQTDIVIVGSGPGGLFAAYELILRSGTRSFNIVVIDKGHAPLNRKCSALANQCKNCKICDLISGGGGAGLFSDRKLILDLNVGGHLRGLLSNNELKDEIINQIKSTILAFCTPNSYIYKEAPQNDKLYECLENVELCFKPYPVLHLGSRNLRKFIIAFIDYLKNKGIKFLFNAEVTGIIKSEKGWRIKIKEKNIEKEIESKCLILSVGKEGSKWLEYIIKRLGGKIEDNNVYMGVRIEMKTEEIKSLYTLSLDPKICRYFKNNEKIKTHCFCRYGQILLLKYFGEFPLLGGHTPFIETDPEFSIEQFPNSNMAILLRKKTYDWNTCLNYMENVNKITNGKLLVQRLGDYLEGVPTTKEGLMNGKIKPSNQNIVPGYISEEILPNFRDRFIDFIERLGSCIPGICNPDNLIYAPAIEWWMRKIKVNNNMEVCGLMNLYIVGDGSGLTQGMVQAAATGIIAARDIINKLCTRGDLSDCSERRRYKTILYEV